MAHESDGPGAGGVSIEFVFASFRSGGNKRGDGR